MDRWRTVSSVLFEQYLRPFAVVMCSLLLAGVVSSAFIHSSWQQVKAGQVELSLEAVEDTLGHGAVIGVLGGFRTIVADFLWLKLNAAWEQQDRVELNALLRLITTLDPRPEFFWINGARMISYDVPRWRIREAGGYDAISAHRERAIIEEQAEQAFTFLEKARAFHPENYRLVMEVAQIYLNRLKDDAKAAEWFLKASRLPDCPYYVSRMYAELLRKQGKLNEAYTYLTGLYQSLPNDDPYALKNVVLERIHELEAELSIPVWERFMPSGAGIL